MIVLVIHVIFSHLLLPIISNGVAFESKMSFVLVIFNKVLLVFLGVEFD